MRDTYRHKGMRKQLVDEIIQMGVNDKLVIEAIETIPRHFFMDSAFLSHAYQNKAFAIGEGQTISQPYTVAYQTSLLHLEEISREQTVKILEIGTGSGYQTAVLAQLCKQKNAQITSIEFHQNLHQKAKQTLENSANYSIEFDFQSVELVLGDGSQGYLKNAPYDRILVTAATPNIPKKLKHWFEQLKIEGKIVVPVGSQKHQVMCRYTKKDEKTIELERFDTFCFVPLLGKNGF